MGTFVRSHITPKIGVILAIAVLVMASFVGIITQIINAAPTPVAAYNFDEGAGGTLTDVTGNGNNGTISGATWSAAGQNSGALDFDGSNDWVTVADDPSLDLTNQMTVMAWVSPNALQDWTTVVLKERGNGLSYALYGSDNSNNPPVIYGRVGNSDEAATASNNLPTGSWTHIAGTYDGSTFNIYVNGSLVNTSNVSGNMTTSNNPLRIGGNSVWGEYFNGLIDDVRVYNVVLSETEIQNDMNTPVSAPGPDLAPPTVPGNLVGTAVAPTQVDLSWDASTDNIGVTEYRVVRNGVEVASTVTTGFTDVAVSAGTTYEYVVRAADAAGNVSGDSNLVSVTTPVPDNEAPTVSLTAPAEGTPVSGVVAITADANDNVGVTGVEFFVDGASLGEDTEAPYEGSWDTGGLSAGSFALTATARDAAGNETTSSTVNVTITGDFSFEVTTPTQTASAPGDTYFEIDVAYLNGFVSQQLELWVTGLPAGVTGDYLFNPMAHQGKTELLITVDGTALEGTYPITLGATDQDGTSITHSAPATLVIDNTPNFTVAGTPQIQNVVAGNAVSFTATLTGSGGFGDEVTLSASGLPAGAAATFSPASLTPDGNATMNVSTDASTLPGSYTVTITGDGGGVTSTRQVTLVVAASNATWAVEVLGSTGTQNNNVRVGDVRGDGLERVYVGTIGTGRMLEYTWNGSSWDGPLDVGGSPSGTEIHNVTIGDGRGDGQDRIYAASYDNNLYEIWYDGTSWQQQVVVAMNDLGMHAAVGDGRNDGVTRLYSISTRTLYEHTWNGSAWVGGAVSSAPGAHGINVEDGRNDGTNSLFIASISSGSLEGRYVGGSWQVNSMGDSGDVRDIETGDGRNDGVTRVYSGLLDGGIRELTWNGSSWDWLDSNDGGGLIHAYVVNGRNDGVNRIYGSSEDGKSYEFTWNGSNWDVVNMGGGNDYMYGQHFGFGRNDGIIRFYGADRGAVNRVYEYTWTGSQVDTEAPTVPANLNVVEFSPTQVDLSWDASTDNIGVTNYSVLRDGNVIGQTQGTTFSDTNATPGATYTYTVQANDGAGNTSAASNDATITLTNPPDTEAPTDPTNLSAQALGPDRVDLSWDASTDNIAVASYQIVRDGNIIGTSTTTTFSDTSVEAATTYSYVVRAVDPSSNVSGDSNTASATTSNPGAFPGLVAAYSFNEGSGNVLTDAINGHNGTISNASWTSAGQYGGALSFNGSNSWVTIADANELDLTTGMTLEAWVNPNALQDWTTVILKERGNGLSYALYGSDNSNNPPVVYGRVGSDQSATANSNLPIGSWTHIAGTYDGSAFRMYVNGVLVSTTNVSGSMTTSNNVLRIGGNSVWGEYFNGLIDEVRIYDRALDASEIQSDMNTPV